MGGRKDMPPPRDGGPTVSHGVELRNEWAVAREQPRGHDSPGTPTLILDSARHRRLEDAPCVLSQRSPRAPAAKQEATEAVTDRQRVQRSPPRTLPINKHP